MSLFPPGSVALVTGASRGIGAACAKDLALEGAAVVVNFKENEQAAKGVVTEIEEAGGIAEAYQADVADEQQVRALFDHLRAAYGRLDVLVANAGITDDNLLLRMKAEEFRRVVDTNVMGTFFVLREAAKLMSRNKSGAIVTISSITADGAPTVANYASSKAAVATLAKSAASELAQHGVRVNTVSPGLVATDMVEIMPPNVQRAFIERVALGRVARPEEVAKVVTFLASEGASYITGADVPVNGGAQLAMLTTPFTQPDSENRPRRRVAGARPSRPRVSLTGNEPRNETRNDQARNDQARNDQEGATS